MQIGDRVITSYGDIGDIVGKDGDILSVQDYLSRQVHVVHANSVQPLSVVCVNCDNKGCDFCGPELTIRESVV